MNVHEAIENRREITSFTGREIDTEKMERIVKSGYMAPAGNNLPSREFIVITDTDVLKEMADATPFMKWLADSQAGIVVTGRPDVSKYWLQDASIASSASVRPRRIPSRKTTSHLKKWSITENSKRIRNALIKNSQSSILKISP